MGRYLAEGFGEPRLESGIELLVDGLTHLFELFGVVFVEFGEALFDSGAELVLQRGVAGHQLVELGVEGLSETGVPLVSVVGKGIETLRESFELLLDGGAELVVGGFVVAAEGGEAGVEGCAEGGDAGGDLGAEGGEGGLAGLTGTLRLSGDVGAHLGEPVADVLVCGLLASVEAGELVEYLGKAWVLCRGCLLAKEQEDYGEEGDDLEDQERKRHFVFPSPG